MVVARDLAGFIDADRPQGQCEYFVVIRNTVRAVRLPITKQPAASARIAATNRSAFMLCTILATDPPVKDLIAV
jgi:hypothetical protein